MTASAEAEADSPPTRWRRRWLRRLVALTIVAALAGGAYWWWSGRRARELDQLADPATVELPDPPADPAPTVVWLAGPGAPLIAAATAVDWAAIDPDPATCRKAAAELDAVATPTALRNLTETAPDPGTAAVARSFVDSAITFLSNCLAGERPDPADVAFAAQVLDRQSEQLGA